MNFTSRSARALTALLASATLAFAGTAARAQAWQPSNTVEVIVPAGAGGGADQMARLIANIVNKHQLMGQSMVVINRSGGGGADGFMMMKNSSGDPHRLIITLSNLFTTPLASQVAFNWRDLTPVSMMALDNFILWVNAETPYKSAKDYLAAAKTGGKKNILKMGGTGAKQEDQLLTFGLEKSTGAKFEYVALKGGGDVASQLATHQVDSTVNNPIEAIMQWRAGLVRPLCVFDDKRMPYSAKIAAGQAWQDIPTCKEAGVPTAYTMLRGVFMAPGVTETQKQFYVEMLRKVRKTPEWKAYMESGAFNQTVMEGDTFLQWLGKTEQQHRELMAEAGFLAK